MTVFTTPDLLPKPEPTDVGAPLEDWFGNLADATQAAISRPSGMQRRSATAKSLTGNAWNLLNDPTLWQSVQAPSAGLTWSAGGWVVTKPGVYEVELGILLGGTVSMILGIKKNNTVAGQGGLILTSTFTGIASFTSGAISRKMQLAAGDSIIPTAFLSATAGWDNTPDLSHFNIRYVEAIRAAS